DYDDQEALEQLGELSDVITYEFENISANQLKTLVSKYNIPQGYQAIQLLQDRLTEKQTLQDANCKIASFVQLSKPDDLDIAIET
ncbi:5-(carboxyamino)imidazole ribonucleotide synthase, partial [Staphylococcus aureus]|nr:5-(carboxyamino)imidazole ribonucleotide synthase [Staphylococcus aureus]